MPVPNGFNHDEKLKIAIVGGGLVSENSCVSYKLWKRIRKNCDNLDEPFKN